MSIFKEGGGENASSSALAKPGVCIINENLNLCMLCAMAEIERMTFGVLAQYQGNLNLTFKEMIHVGKLDGKSSSFYHNP